MVRHRAIAANIECDFHCNHLLSGAVFFIEELTDIRWYYLVCGSVACYSTGKVGDGILFGT